MSDESEDWIAKASNPTQYDAEALNWASEGSESSPTRKFLQRVLREHLGDQTGNSIIDIGSGTGHVLSVFPEAKRYVGVEPSRSNILLAQKQYPQAEFIQAQLETLHTTESFDVGIVLFVFEHLKDAAAAFEKLASLVQSGGILCVVTLDFAYAQTQRPTRHVTVRKIGPGEIVCETVRSYGTLYDIVRTPEVMTRAAFANGFILERQIPLIPDKELVLAESKYTDMQHVAFGQIYLFRRSEE